MTQGLDGSEKWPMSAGMFITELTGWVGGWHDRRYFHSDGQGFGRGMWQHLFVLRSPGSFGAAVAAAVIRTEASIISY